MISAQMDQSVQSHLIEKYMALPNRVWDGIIIQATQVCYPSPSSPFHGTLVKSRLSATSGISQMLADNREWRIIEQDGEWRTSILRISGPMGLMLDCDSGGKLRIDFTKKSFSLTTFPHMRSKTAFFQRPYFQWLLWNLRINSAELRLLISGFHGVEESGSSEAVGEHSEDECPRL